jgi:oligopeptide/dipeptide ABC transporter ATP-binding protein
LEPILRVQNLTTEFTTPEGKARAVDDVSFEVMPGKTLALVGESGCGKTVTALSIIGLIPNPPGKIISGNVFFRSINLTKLNNEQMRDIRGARISMVFQEPMTSLNPVFTIGDQIMESIILHQKVSKKEAELEAIKSLESVGIPDPEKQIRAYPHQLSGGMRQRVMIAMAMSCHPELLIADEPTTALDVTIQAQILQLMNNLREQEGMSLLLITHNLGVVAETADDVAVMYLGQVVEQSSVGDIFEKPLHPYTQGLLNSLPDPEAPADSKLIPIKGLVPSITKKLKGCRFAERCPERFNACTLPPELKNIGGHLVRCHLYK